MTICQKKSGGRILCIRLSGLGDVTHALNALSRLREARPDAHIAWAVEDRFADLLHGHPCLDELIVVRRGALGRALANPVRWGSLGREAHDVARRLRAGEFDTSVDFQSSLKSAWLVLAARADVRIGFGGRVNRELNRLVQTTLVSVPTRGVHRIERDLALLAPLGIPACYAAPRLPRFAAEGEVVEQFLADCDGVPLVVIHPGTSSFAAFKRWMPERYAAVADGLVRERGARVVLSYGPEERSLVDAILDLMREHGRPAPQVGGLRGLCELLRRADLFVGSDTGPMHIAGALGVPVVALFGPKDPVQTGPYCSRSVVVEGGASCRPCTRRRCSHVRCMTSISEGRVLDAALTVLDGGGQARAAEGRLRKAMTWPFRLGEWRGHVAACHSSPDFFTWLCEPEAIVEGERSPGGWRSAGLPDSAAGASDDGVALSARMEGSTRWWSNAVRLTAAGVPVPFPVCRMTRSHALGVEEFALREAPQGAVTLADWLLSSGGRSLGSLSSADRTSLIRLVAAAVRRLHEAGFRHGDLRAENLLLWAAGPVARWRILLSGLDRARWVGWIPAFARDILWAKDLRTLLESLSTTVSHRDRVRFFRAYCDGFIDERHRRHVLIRTVG